MAAVVVAGIVALAACAPGDGEAGAPSPGPTATTATTARDRRVAGCPVGEGEVSEVLGFAVARRAPLVGGRCTFLAVDVAAHRGASVELLVLVDPDALAAARADVEARTGATPAPARVEGATEAYRLGLGVVAQVGAVDAVGGVVVTVADPARAAAAAGEVAIALAALALR
ncbi:MAG: hypothetical protein WKF93_06615 [Acidimicrobiales bacterium]